MQEFQFTFELHMQVAAVSGMEVTNTWFFVMISYLKLILRCSASACRTSSCPGGNKSYEKA